MSDPKDYVYSTSEMAGYYGLTRKGLAYYEERGIISPERKKGNAYRVYSLSDCYNMYHAKLYENCGYSLAETAKTLKRASAVEAVCTLDVHLEQMEREAAYRARLIRRAGEVNALLKRSLEGPICEIALRPACYRLFVRTYCEEHVSLPHETCEFERWNRDVPIDRASLLCSAAMLAGESPMNVGIGNIVTEEDFAFLGYAHSPRVTCYPPRRCLHIVSCRPADGINTPGFFEDVTAALDRMGLACTGDILTAMLAVTVEDGVRMRHEEFWAPVV